MPHVTKIFGAVVESILNLCQVKLKAETYCALSGVGAFCCGHSTRSICSTVGAGRVAEATYA
eukprot:4342191-Amphidinium_carterae.1